jgi:hypothetical protein
MFNELLNFVLIKHLFECVVIFFTYTISNIGVCVLCTQNQTWFLPGPKGS